MNFERTKKFAIAMLALAAQIASAAVEADVACCYAPSYAASVGGEDNAQVLLANAVIGNNLINDQSGTGARMRIAGYYMSTNDPINQTTTGGMVGWLDSDPRMQNVRDFAVSVGADLVTYVCQNSDSGSIAAVAQQPGMYSALNPGAVWYVVFAHEVGGHNYGCSHADGLLNPKTVMLHNYCGGGANPYFTNPSMWLNGVQLLGDGNNCGQGALISSGDNSWRVGVSAQGVADRRARIVVGPDLDHVVYRWCFTNAVGSAPAGTTNLDLVSGAPAVVRGLGAAFTGNAVRVPGLTTGNVAANSISAYIDLPNGIVSAHTNITIEIWATPLSAKNWGRIFDLGRTVQAGDGLGAPGEYTGEPGTAAPGVTQSSDDIMLTATINTDLNQQRFEAKRDGTAVTLDSGLSTTAGVQHHYAVTFTDGAGTNGSAGGRWQWYRDGDPIAYLDVSFHLADIEDVNNWLGRSLWSADSNANVDYAEVRLSNVALTRGRVLANYLLGPNYFPGATVTMTNTDVLGTTSFNAAGQWNNGAAPSGGNSYETVNFTLRTPATGNPYTFAGNSLRLSGGYLLYKGTSSSVITINNLTLNGGSVNNAGSAAFTLGGSISVTTNGGTFNGVNAGSTISAPLSGSGPLTFLANPATLSGANAAFTGKILIGNGVPGTLIIDSQARLGTAPAVFTTDQLTLNRGTLQTTTTMSLDNANRGILLGPAGGTFNVAAGTILTLSSPMSIPVTGASVVAGSLAKAGSGTLVLNCPGNAFRGTLFVDTGSSSANDGVVRVANNLVLANAHSPIFIRNNTSGSSTLQLDGTTGNIVLTQRLSVACRNSAVAAVQNLAGTNMITGGVSLSVGGSFFNLRSESGLLTLSGANQYVGSTVGNRTFAFNGAGNFLVSGPILNSTNGSVIGVSKSGVGILTLAGGNSYTGTTVVGGGTLIVNGTVGAGAVSIASSTLAGNGTINGPVTVQSSGVLAPGTSIGTLTINNGLSLSGTTLMELNAADGTSDLVQGLTSVTYGGTLSLSNLNGTISATNTFKLFAAATYNGAFSSILPLEPGPDLAWNTNSLAIDGTLRITSKTPAPIGFSMSNGALGLSWPAEQTGWRLQVQTNSLADASGWTDVAGSTLTNLIVVPIDLAAEAVFYRLIFP